ncbi:MAG: DUF6491 family protein [Xanthomonadales bacterium]|nr:DUF6491 family protein [Xanthomonadales bacterium]
MNARNMLILIASSLLAVPAAAEEKKMNSDLEFVSGPPEQCVSLIRIDRTEVLDDQNILFHMRGDDIYLNHLPHRCPNLGFEESFMYRTSLNQLCNVDIITVLNDIGFGFSPGPSCGLGLFYPVSEEDVSRMREKTGK